MCPDYNEQANRARILRLAERGVRLWGPERVYVGEEVRLGNICPGAELLNAFITGENTFIGSGAKIGVSGLARIHESQIGPSCVLGAGSYEHCVFLNGAKARGFAEIRQGTVLEEEAEVAHNVGLKNTVFTIGVVAGSCINYCDVVVTGGSSRSDHSEIGSGAIHFNFDPRGDKFGSLLGDATGLLLRSRRIFIGGNSGLIAPVHLGFGAVIAAGSMIRKDVGENQLSSGEPLQQGGDYDLEKYYDLSRKFCTTAKLIGTLQAMRGWYRLLRLPFSDSTSNLLCLAADRQLEHHIRYRVEQLTKVIDKLERSLSKPCATAQYRQFQQQHRKLLDNRDNIGAFLLEERPVQPPTTVISEYERNRRTQDHAASIRGLSNEAAELATAWLKEIAAAPQLRMRALFLE
jgi:bifunctional UDP-N-acetylglucosamine pyrophosphorylase / glucosamine-1-phosphate N-acetyltransferase